MTLRDKYILPKFEAVSDDQLFEKSVAVNTTVTLILTEKTNKHSQIQTYGWTLPTPLYCVLSRFIVLHVVFFFNFDCSLTWSEYPVAWPQLR